MTFGATDLYVHESTEWPFGFDQWLAYSYLVDKEQSGFLTWAKSFHAYIPPPKTGSAFTWEAGSRPILQVIQGAINDDWIDKFVARLSQEGAKASTTSTVDLRPDVIIFAKSLCRQNRGGFASDADTLA